MLFTITSSLRSLIFSNIFTGLLKRNKDSTSNKSTSSPQKKRSICVRINGMNLHEQCSDSIGSCKLFTNQVNTFRPILIEFAGCDWCSTKSNRTLTVCLLDLSSIVSCFDPIFICRESRDSDLFFNHSVFFLFYLFCAVPFFFAQLLPLVWLTIWSSNRKVDSKASTNLLVKLYKGFFVLSNWTKRTIAHVFQQFRLYTWIYSLQYVGLSQCS